ncbi:hypothetical protein FGF80_18520 (plasmid) [Natrinema pallidum]|uniref:Uncharacterized protein n=1 Tax=Natrinema pallidum TaxID=69527 RepID=A0A4V1IFJ8_9EURY|nr:hypothetical protein [Natrinema pallidum]QCW05244.1 hypothetical protein FGF80_18520 [Natrinema pallidum]
MLAEGCHVVVVDDPRHYDTSLKTRVLSRLLLQSVDPPPTLVISDPPFAEDDAIRVRAERSHLDGVYVQADDVAVLEDGIDDTASPIDKPGSCQWCSTDYSRYGRLFGSLFATLHAIRRHPDELEHVADGADPEEVPAQDSDPFQISGSIDIVSVGLLIAVVGLATSYYEFVGYGRYLTAAGLALVALGVVKVTYDHATGFGGDSE